MKSLKDLRRICLFAFIMLMGLQSIYAQSNFQGSLNFLVGLPQGEFKDNINSNGYGLGGDFIYSPARSPFGIGATFGFLIYGSETRREPFSTTIPDVEVDVTTDNSILQGHILLRAQSKEGLIQPYIDGLLGFNYLFTQTRIEDIGGVDEEVASSTNYDDTAFSYGGGGGAMIRVYDGFVDSDAGKQHYLAVNVDLRVRYIRGAEAEYLKKGSIRRVKEKVFYDVKQSTTDFVTIQVGASIAF